MAGLVPAIHVFTPRAEKAWMAGTGPAMTGERWNRGALIPQALIVRVWPINRLSAFPSPLWGGIKGGGVNAPL